jgi:hypothetical protein
MDTRRNYSGFHIDARCYEFWDRSGWAAEYRITGRFDSGVTGTLFLLQDTFRTSRSAIRAAITAAQTRIDTIKLPEVGPGRLLKPVTGRHVKVA